MSNNITEHYSVGKSLFAERAAVVGCNLVTDWTVVAKYPWYFSAAPSDYFCELAFRRCAVLTTSVVTTLA
jgi:hypothetical protein